MPIRSNPRSTGLNGVGSTAAPTCAAMLAAAASAFYRHDGRKRPAT
jgi:hypothetical protein